MPSRETYVLFVRKGKCPKVGISIEECFSHSKNVAFKRLYAKG